MNKKQLLVSSILVVCVIVVSIILFTKKDRANVLTIGFIAPLTGDKAAWGEGLQHVAHMAEAQFGQTKHHYRFIFEDNKLDNGASAVAAEKLISVDHADVLITLSSGPGVTVSPIAEKEHVVHFGIASALNVANGSYSFDNWTPPTEQVHLFVQELQKRRVKKLGVFELTQDGIKAIMTELRKQLAGTDIQIVTDQSFSSGEHDFHTMITKARESKPDIYVLQAFPPELELLYKQLREQDSTIPVTAMNSFELAKQPQLFEGYWYVAGADPNDEFLKAYMDQFKTTPTIGAPNAYDIINLVVATAEKLPTEKLHDHAALLGELKNIHSFNGILGNLNINDAGLIAPPASLHIIKDGKPTKLK